MNHVFIGMDQRQAVSYTVAASSFALAARTPIAISPINADLVGMKREGLTPFTWARFLVPYLCDFKGWALFVDGDVVCLQDPAAVFQEADLSKAVMVVDTSKQFERAAVMLFNCAHPDNRILTPEYVETANGLHQIRWTTNIGFLDKRWNHLVGYDQPDAAPGIIHYTMGVPCWEQTSDCEHRDIWWLVHKLMNSAQPWEKIMGNSVHNGLNDDNEKVPLYKATKTLNGERLSDAPQNA
jgi:lipopolysaccharide biosynthesis glycosyltransferase